MFTENLDNGNNSIINISSKKIQKQTMKFLKYLCSDYIPFNIESLILYKKFLASDSLEFFTKDFLSLCINLGENINKITIDKLSQNIYSKGYENMQIYEKKIIDILLIFRIDLYFKFYFSCLSKGRKRDSQMNKNNNIVKMLESHLGINFEYKNICNHLEYLKIREDQINEFSKIAPYSYFVNLITKESFLNDSKIIEPVLIMLLNLAYFIIYILIKILDSMVLSFVSPKSLKQKFQMIDDIFKIYNKHKEKKEINSDYNQKLVFILSFIKHIHSSSEKEIKQTILNIINSVFKFFNHLKHKTRILIRNNQTILEILINFLIYKNYFDSEFNNASITQQKTINNNFKLNSRCIENKFEKKTNSILKPFDKILIFKTIIMLLDLNKTNKSYVKIISKLNIFVSLYSYNNLMCLFKVFDLSNINLEIITKLIKKLFCSVPVSMKKKDYFRKVINCFYDLIIILKNRDKDEKLSGLKEFTLNIFNEIIISFSDYIDFSNYLFYKFFSRFFLIFGYKLSTKNNSIAEKRTCITNNSQQKSVYFGKIKSFKNNKSCHIIKIDDKFSNYLDFLKTNFDITIKNKFQKLFEHLDNNLIFESLICIISSLIKKNNFNESLIHDNNFNKENLSVKYDERIDNEEIKNKMKSLCCLLLCNFEINNLAFLMFNYYNSEILSNIFDFENKTQVSNFIYEFENNHNTTKKTFRILIKRTQINDLYKNLLYYSDFNTSVEYLYVLGNIFELNIFSSTDFLKAFLEILTENNFFESRNLSFNDIINEEKIFIHYSQANKIDSSDKSSQINKKPPIKLELLKLNYFDSLNMNVSEDELNELIYKTNNFNLIIKNKIFEIFSNKLISSYELLLEVKEQAFKFILMILNNIPEKNLKNSDELENEIENNQMDGNYDNEIIGIVVNCIGFFLSLASKTEKNQIKIDKEEQNLKFLIFLNADNLIEKLKILEPKHPDCSFIIEKIKILCLEKNAEKAKNNQKINSRISIPNDTPEKIEETNISKISHILNKVEDELKNLLKNDENNSNFEKSFILYRTVNLLNKETNVLKIEKIKIKNANLLILEKIKGLFDIYIEFIKNVDDYLWRIAQKNIIALFEIFFLFENKNNFELFFSIIATTIRNIKNLSNKSEYINNQRVEISKKKDQAVRSIKGKDSDVSAKLSNKKKEINLESQYFLKIIELIELLLKKNKHAIIFFHKNIFIMIYEIFDEHFYTYEPIIISSLFSILGTMLNYCGLKISSEMNTLVRTCINILKNFKENIDIRRASANLLYKILTKCNFLHYQNYAREIYNVIKLNLDNRIENDKIVLFFMEKCVKFIKESVHEFYNLEIELALMKNELNIPKSDD